MSYKFSTTNYKFYLNERFMKVSSLLLIFIILSTSFFTYAQTFKVTGYKRGNIQWQSSENAIDWVDLSGANSEELNGMDVNNELFYRAKITDDSCEPHYSPVYKVGDRALNQVSFEQVELTDPFWSNRMKVQKEVLLPIAFARTESAVEDLRRTANYLKGIPDNLPSTSRYVISDLFKVIEGAAYLLKTERDDELEKQIDEIADILAGAQEDDGYIYPPHTTGLATSGNYGDMGRTRYSYVVHSHELYNVGHLYEAAVAYYQATGKRNLLQIAEKNAKHVNKVFFEGGDNKYNNGNPINQAPGHQEIELALVKLYKATSNPLYLKMSKKFIDIRGITYVPKGNGVLAPEYAQQHAPVREQSEAVGHAVRATYLYSAMADVQACTNDATLLPALHSIWSNIVDTRMHITGGLGAVHGIEGFGPQYVLPNAGAFDETCAAVGNVLQNYRLFLMEKNAKYIDVAEVALYNNVLAGVSLSGDKFFYVNPLESDGRSPFNHGSAVRSQWFGTACCPTNLARLIPQIAGMMYSYTDDEIYCTFYAGSKTSIPLRAGKVEIEQTGSYPFDGNIELKILSAVAKDFKLKIRIPTWSGAQFVPGTLYSYADGKSPQWELRINGETIENVIVEKGFAVLTRTWNTGDVVQLELPMPVRYVHADEKVIADIGRVAITKGPLVFCAEDKDNAHDIFSYFVDNISAENNISFISGGELNGITQIDVPAKTIEKYNVEGIQDVVLKLIPYYAWNNRGAAQMMIWFPKTDELAKENFYIAPEFIKSLEASHSFVGGAGYGPEDVYSVIDGLIPSNSSSTNIPRWTTWPQKGINQWIVAHFNRPVDIARTAIYWYEDTDGVKMPSSWSMEYYENGTWKDFPLSLNCKYGVTKNKFNTASSDIAISAEKLRINMTPQSGKTVGILEMQITEATGIIRNVNASHTFESDDLYGIIDGKYPAVSNDTSIPRWTSWPQQSTEQWIEFKLNKKTNIQDFSVYWYEDSGGVKTPAKWSLKYKSESGWVDFPLYITDSYQVKKDQFNMVHPAQEIVTDEIRMEIIPQSGKAVGILEVIITEINK